MYVLVHVCLMQSFVKLYALGLNVTLKMYSKMRNTCSGHFYLIVNFKVTVRKYMSLYNLNGYFNINRKHSSSVKACSINKLTVYIICKMHCYCVVFLQTKLLKITCYKYLFVRTLQLLTAIIVSACDIISSSNKCIYQS